MRPETGEIRSNINVIYITTLSFTFNNMFEKYSM